MNLKNSKNRAGFTLIELIVVIAIMAILAGVAVPVYSGYIEKAEKAADLQLLDAVNSAFGAAVYENGGNPRQLSGASIGLTGTEGAKTIDSVSAKNASGDLAVQASFDRYFAGNESAVFKTITALGYDKVNGVFVDLASATGNVTLSYGGSYVTVPAESVQAVQNSTFGEIGGETLLGQVDSVSQLTLASILGDGGTFQKVVYTEDGDLSEEYLSTLADTLNMDVNDLYAHMETFETDDQLNGFLANSLILTAAGAAADKDVDYVTGILESDANAYIADIKAGLSDPATAQNALADAALIYGVYTSYVYATDPNGAQAKLDKVNGSAGLTEALTAMQSEDFADYMENKGGKNDLTAYLEAMKVVDNAASTPEAALDVMDKGFNDPELVKLMQSVMGK